MKKAIVLCSGGLDSVVTSHYIKKTLKFNKLYLLFFDYGQRALNMEKRFSKRCSKDLKTKFLEVKIDFMKKYSNSLIKKNEGKKPSGLMNTKKESAQWYVPQRNLVFLTSALSLAENLGCEEIFVGFKNEGAEPFPDSTEEFVKSINSVASLTARGIRIAAPFIKKDKEDIVCVGRELGVDFRETYSCYIGGEIHCGECLACRLRKAGFYWANIRDPTKYLK